MKPKDSDFETLGVVTSAMTLDRHPVACMIAKNKKTGDLSYQFGLFRRGRIQPMRYWRGDKLMQLSAISMLVGKLALYQALTGINYGVETVKAIVDNNPQLRWVDEFIPDESRQKVEMTLGERVHKR